MFYLYLRHQKLNMATVINQKQSTTLSFMQKQKLANAQFVERESNQAAVSSTQSAVRIWQFTAFIRQVISVLKIVNNPIYKLYNDPTYEKLRLAKQLSNNQSTNILNKERESSKYKLKRKFKLQFW